MGLVIIAGLFPYSLIYTMPKRNRRVSENAIRWKKIWGFLWKFVICAALLSFLAMDGYKSVPRFKYWWRNRAIKQDYLEEIESLRQKRQQLRETKNKLESNLLTQERIAREMGYIKPGETVYKIK